MKVVAHLLAADGAIPNHPRWPLLVYPGAVAIEGDDPAARFEELFGRNRWPAAWRNGIYPVHHYHPDGHEALGIYSGVVTVQFGGDAGVTLTANPGDVIVLPAGTGHKKLSVKGSLGVVGAYPSEAEPSIRMFPFGATNDSAAVARVPRPETDPVHGASGPLLAHWKA